MKAILVRSLSSSFQPVIGQAILIRPLMAADSAIEAAFIRALSVETRNRRLLGGARPVTDDYVARLTRVDYPRELALAAVVMLGDSETLIGVARYALEPGGAGCEFAIVVADAWQRRGIGTQLLGRLVAAARAHAIPSMSGYVLATNGATLAFARESGFRVQRVAGDATVLQVVLDLLPTN